ncbi:MAG: SLC13 family permease [Halobacteriales archaeon]|nr:SLC13 family permease [Halobacteriales archaeon]
MGAGPLVPLQAGLPWGLTPDMLVVLGVIAVAMVLFTVERVPVDLTAILVMVLLIVLEPWTRISVAEGISGFSNPATVTVLAMLILSAGVSKTGIVQQLGSRLSAVAGESSFRQLAATVGAAGPSSGFINNTPVVAILVPVVSDLAHRGGTSPSKLLMPLSFASMLGGTLTVIGTSSNILASDISGRLLGQPISMFEFAHLGLIVLVVGTAYLLTIGNWLVPERIAPREEYVEEYELSDYLTDVVVREDSPLVGRTVAGALEETGLDIDVVEVTRGTRTYGEPLGRLVIEPGDVFTVRTDRPTVQQLVDLEGVDLGSAEVHDADLAADDDLQLFEVVIASGSNLAGETLDSAAFRQRFEATVLAFKSHGAIVRDRLDRRPLRVGDTLLVQATEENLDRLSQTRDVIVAHEPSQPEYRSEKIPHAVAIIAGVVLLPALGLLPIVVSALAGVVAMAAAGVLRPTELYESVDWHVIFLLAGVIPLGIALEQTGAATLLGESVAASAGVLPVIGVLWVVYAVTSLLTNVISNNASVVLMIPVAVEAAQGIGANPFAFVLAAMFAASTAFMTPVGYQTNLFVYGAGGYRFADYFRVGAPLQLLLSVVTVVGIAMFWPL